MLITKTQITHSLRLLCRKYDHGQRKGTAYRFLRKWFNTGAFIKLALFEINGMTLDSDPYPKHKRVAGLWTFTKKGFKHPKFFSLNDLIADMADFISSSQIEVKRLLEINKRGAPTKKI